MREHSTKVVRDIISGLAAYIQSQFISQSSTSQSSGNSFLHIDCESATSNVNNSIAVLISASLRRLLFDVNTHAAYS